MVDSSFACPNCGERLEVRAASNNRAGWQRQSWQSFATGPDVHSLPPGASWVRREPARAPTGADVVVPAAWAGLTGVALGLAAIPVTVWQRWEWWTPLAVLAGGAAATWFVLLADWRRALWRIEEMTGVDVDGDEQIGPPPISTIRVEVAEGRSMTFLDLPLDQARTTTLARLALAGRLSERDVALVLDRKTWGNLRARLLDGGFVRWRNPAEPRSGLLLTAKGRAVFTTLAGR